MNRNLLDGPLVILGLDPGGTTGWALYTCDLIHDPEGNIEFYNEKWDTGEMGPEHHHRKLWNFLHHWNCINFFVVCESFDFRKDDQERDKIEYISAQYEGIVALFGEEWPTDYPVPRVVFQSASTGKGFWYPRKNKKRDPYKLKRVGKYTPGSTHKNDAMAHLLHWMSFGPLDRRDLFQGLR